MCGVEIKNGEDIEHRHNLNNVNSEHTYIFLDEILFSFQFMTLLNIFKLAKNKGIDTRIVDMAKLFMTLHKDKETKPRYDLFMLCREEWEVIPEDAVRFVRSCDGFESRTVTSKLHDNIRALLHYSRNFSLVYTDDYEKDLASGVSAKALGKLQVISYDVFTKQVTKREGGKTSILVANPSIMDDILKTFNNKVIMYRPRNLQCYGSDILSRTLAIDIW
ncbi:MAG: hypothetical protein ACRCZ9_12370 [Fusobacteriaceae bacterium]